MSKKKGNSRGIPVDMSDFSEELGSGAYALPKASTTLSALDGFSLLSARPNKSNKERIQAAEAEAARIIEKAKTEKAKQVESDRLYKEYMKKHKKITCALCNNVAYVDDAIAHKWKNDSGPFGFANQAICDKCDAAHPLKAKTTLKRETNILSARQKRLQGLLQRAPPPNALKAMIAETAVFDLTPKQREVSLLSGMRKQLSAKFLTPPVAEVIPFGKAELAKFTDATYKRNRGGTKSKSKSKSKRSKSRSKSRF